MATSVLGVAFLGGCATTLNVASEPAGAQVLWSPTGVQDWRPWPPRTWNATISDQEREPVFTPYKDSATFSDTVWITVEKEGYYRPLPQVAQLYSQNHEKLVFKLVETPELEEQRLRAEGYVLYKGEFVKPEELNLVEYKGSWFTAPEADLLSKRDAGLIQYKDRWVTVDERDRLYAEDQRALGFIQFKNRWVKPEVQAKEVAVDEQVTKLFAEQTTELRAPRVVGSLNQDLSQLQIHNSSRLPIRVYLSGVRSDELVLDAYETYGTQQDNRFTILPGEYRIAVVSATSPLASAASDQDTAEGAAQDAQALAEALSQTEPVETVSTTTTTFKGGLQYLITFEVNPQENSGRLQEYQRQEPTLPEGLPTIEIPEINLPEKPKGPPGAGGGAGGGGRGGGGGRRS